MNSIAPIFLLIALGKVLQKAGFFSEVFFKSLNRFVFWFALPSLLISRISAAPLDLETISRIVFLLSAGTLLSLTVAWGIARIMKLPVPSTGSFIQGSFRGNGAFVGLPVIIYSLGTLDPKAEALATLILAPVVILFNILGVIVLTHYSREQQGAAKSIQRFFMELIKNPLILACALGLALNLFTIKIPPFIYRPLDALGSSALALILLSIGAGLKFEKLRGVASPSLIASLLKTVVTPTIGLLIAGLFDLDTTGKMIAIFFLAAPAAGMSYVMADVMGNDASLAGRIVALSTLISAITLPIIIAIGL